MRRTGMMGTGVGTRTLLLTLLLASLLIAGVASFYASGHPDGLEFVAGETGFLDSAGDSRAAGSPFADYQTSWLDDARLSGGLAGVLGAVVVLLLASVLAYAVRRRGSDDST